MKTYQVTIPIVGEATYTVQAATVKQAEKQALQLFENEPMMTTAGRITHLETDAVDEIGCHVEEVTA